MCAECCPVTPDWPSRTGSTHHPGVVRLGLLPAGRPSQWRCPWLTTKTIVPSSSRIGLLRLATSIMFRRKNRQRQRGQVAWGLAWLDVWFVLQPLAAGWCMRITLDLLPHSLGLCRDYACDWARRRLKIPNTPNHILTLKTCRLQSPPFRCRNSLLSL